MWAVLAGALLPGAGRAQTPDPLYYDDPTYTWLDNRDPEAARASPSAVAGLQIGFSRVWVAYGRPGARDRKVMGGLVRYGVVWRTGADEAAVLTTTGLIEIEGHELDPGSYAIFTIPGEEEWTIILSRKHNHWGESYDPSADLVRFTVRPEPAEFTERMEFSFEQIDPDSFSAVLALTWERTKVPVRVVEP